MELNDLQQIYNGKKKSITTKLSGIKVCAKIEKDNPNNILIYVDDVFVAQSVSDFDYLLQVINEEIENKIDTMKSNIEANRNFKIRSMKESFVELSISKSKEAILDICKGYFGSIIEAQTGSEYLFINGKTLRFSDHERSSTSKWNFVYTGSYINAPVGIIFKSDFKNFIEKELSIKKYDLVAFDNLFKNN